MGKGGGGSAPDRERRFRSPRPCVYRLAPSAKRFRHASLHPRTRWGLRAVRKRRDSRSRSAKEDSDTGNGTLPAVQGVDERALRVLGTRAGHVPLGPFAGPAPLKKCTVCRQLPAFLCNRYDIYIYERMFFDSPNRLTRNRSTRRRLLPRSNKNSI